MKSSNFKYLFGLIVILGLFLASCTNTTEPVDSINKVEYMPKQAEAEDLAESLLIESFKITTESFVGKELINQSYGLAKSNGGQSYFYFDGWHTWRGEIDASPFGIEDSYNAEYLAKIQFQDGVKAPMQFPQGAQLMLMYLKAHAAFGFVNNEPYGDEVWYDFQGAATPLHGFPTVINAGGEYERRWVGIFNGEDTEIHYKVQVLANNVQFFYDGNANDFYLNGIVNIAMNGFKVLARFTNSRMAMVEIYQGTTLVGTRQFELPNFYAMMNIPSLNNWNFGANFTFPIPVSFNP